MYALFILLIYAKEVSSVFISRWGCYIGVKLSNLLTSLHRIAPLMINWLHDMVFFLQIFLVSYKVGLDLRRICKLGDQTPILLVFVKKDEPLGSLSLLFILNGGDEHVSLNSGGTLG